MPVVVPKFISVFVCFEIGHIAPSHHVPYLDFTSQIQENTKQEAHAVFQPYVFFPRKEIFFGLELWTVGKIVSVGDYLLDYVAGFSVVLFGYQRAEIELTENLVLIYDLHYELLVAGAGIEPTCMAYETIE